MVKKVFWRKRYLQLLLLEHVRLRGIEDVVSQLSLTIYVDRRCGFTGQEAVVDLPGTLRELKEGQARREAAGWRRHTHKVTNRERTKMINEES